MKIDQIIKEKEVSITNHGMITIPSIFRKNYNLKDGDKILIVEDEGTLKIIPLRNSEQLRKDSYTTKEMMSQIEKSRKEEIKRES